MSSLIHYRFKAGLGDWSRLSFEGHALPLYELKKQIVAAKKLNPIDQTDGGGGAGGGGRGEGAGRTLQDFELIITNGSARTQRQTQAEDERM